MMYFVSDWMRSRNSITKFEYTFIIFIKLEHHLYYASWDNHIISYHVMSCHVMSCHVMSCHVMSCHVMSCHVIPYPISYHITIYNLSSIMHYLSYIIYHYIIYIIHHIYNLYHTSCIIYHISYIIYLFIYLFFSADQPKTVDNIF